MHFFILNAYDINLILYEAMKNIGDEKVVRFFNKIVNEIKWTQFKTGFRVLDNEESKAQQII